jgi:hypothetical protein
VPAVERHPQRLARQHGSQHLSQHIGRHLQTLTLSEWSIRSTRYALLDSSFHWMSLSAGTCFHGKRRQVAKATVTAGFKDHNIHTKYLDIASLPSIRFITKIPWNAFFNARFT